MEKGKNPAWAVCASSTPMEEPKSAPWVDMSASDVNMVEPLMPLFEKRLQVCCPPTKGEVVYENPKMPIR